jgi:hypothetical protein
VQVQWQATSLCDLPVLLEVKEREGGNDDNRHTPGSERRSPADDQKRTDFATKNAPHLLVAAIIFQL